MGRKRAAHLALLVLTKVNVDYKPWLEPLIQEIDATAPFDFDARIQICEDNFDELGAGSARTVFEVSDGEALKMAHNRKGLAQNKAEEWVLTNYQHVFPQILGAHPKNWWLMAQRAEPFAEGDFTRLQHVIAPDNRVVVDEPLMEAVLKAGVMVGSNGSERGWSWILGEMFDLGYMSDQAVIEAATVFGEDHADHRAEIFDGLKQTFIDDLLPAVLPDGFINVILEVSEKTKLMIGDLTRSSTYGEIDGDLVIIDAGFTIEVWEEHY